MEKPIGIYIHFPFCKKKCPYCSFYSLENENEILKSEYIEKLCEEIRFWGKKLKRSVDSVYFGGGTPSLFKASEILKVLNTVRQNFKFENPEVTLEVNPADYFLIDFDKLHFGGVNRVSVGAQTMDDKGLKILGRRHSVRDTINTFEQIKLAKIDNISFDLIVGYPHQTKSDIDNFINFCAENKIPHVSSYLLKVEEGTPYFKSGLDFISDDMLADYYLYISKKMESLGYKHYEISNFCLPKKESRHNLKYWNLDDYLGIGPSAHSLLNSERFYYENDLKDFLSSPKTKSEGKFDAKEEYVMLRLRLADGLDAEKYKEKFGVCIPQKYFEKAKKFENMGFVKVDKNGTRLGANGFLLSNKIIGDLIF